MSDVGVTFKIQYTNTTNDMLKAVVTQQKCYRLNNIVISVQIVKGLKVQIMRMTCQQSRYKNDNYHYRAHYIMIIINMQIDGMKRTNYSM